MIQLYRPVEKCPSPFKIAKRDEQGSSFNLITQGFGECLPSVCQWYEDLGLKSHNGLDWMVAYVDCFASHDGTVFKTLNSSNSSPTAGYGVYIRHDEGWWTLYFHLSEVLVKVGDRVKAGDKIGITGNTGKYTVGPHLHFGLYPANPDYNNGWGGAIDPMLYFSLEEILGTANQLNNNMIVDRTLLHKIYQATFKREPDPEADFYLGKEVSDVLDILINSKENKYYTAVYQAVKKIEKELK